MTYQGYLRDHFAFPFTIHSLYTETLQIFLNVSNILFKLTKNKLNLRAQITKISVQMWLSLERNKKSKNLNVLYPQMRSLWSWGLNASPPVFAAGFLEGDPSFMQRRKVSIQNRWGRSQFLSVRWTSWIKHISIGKFCWKFWCISSNHFQIGNWLTL